MASKTKLEQLKELYGDTPTTQPTRAIDYLKSLAQKPLDQTPVTDVNTGGVKPATPPAQNLPNIGTEIGQMGEIMPAAKQNTIQDIYGNVGADIGKMGDIGTNPTGALTGDQIKANNVTEKDTVTPTPQQQTMNDYAEWYKANVGTEFKGQNLLTKPVGMDYSTWATGQTLYNLYEQSKLADESLASQTGEINAAQSKEEQQAYITYQKMQKYIQMANAAQGIGSISAGDQIAMGNNYQNQLGDVGYKYNSLKQDAQQQAAAAKKEATSKAQSNLSSIYATEEQQVQAEKQAQIEQTASLVANKLDEMYAGFAVDETTGEISNQDYQKMVTFYNQYKDTLDDATRNTIEFILENNYDYAQAAQSTSQSTSQKTTADGTQIDGFAGADGKPDAVNNFISGEKNSGTNTYDYDGKKYKITGDAQDASVLERYYGTMEEGKVYSYSLEKYIYANGKIYKVKKV